MIAATCPNCHYPLQAPESFANKRVKCPKCQTVFTIPNPKADSTPSSAITAAPAVEPSTSFARPLVIGPSRSWRYLSSPWVVMIFLFGFLPWCEVSCNSREIDFHLSQSGYQALWGGVSAPPAMDEMLARQSEQKNFSRNLHQSSVGLGKQLGIEQSYLANVSPFLIFFWGANLALIGIICFVPLGNRRLGFALPLCGLLSAVLILHACLGLPLERRFGQAIVEAIREDPSNPLPFLVAFKCGKTVWFWLTLASVVLLAITEPLLNWLRAERWSSWLAPTCITGGATSLMLVGVIVQFAVREINVRDMENHIGQLRKAEEDARMRAEDERRRRQEERLAEIRRSEAEAERLRQQAALEAEKTRLEQQRRLRERVEEDRRRQEELKELQRRAFVERQRQEEERRRLLLEKQRQENEREAVRKAELEKKGLPYYPRPQTPYQGRSADEWGNIALHNVIKTRMQAEASEALKALETLKEEGMPYLLDLLRKQKTLAGRRLVLQRIQAEYIHPNDLKQLLPYLERNRALERSRDFVTTRMLALRCLHKRAEHLKELLPKIEDSVKDLLIVSVYKEEIQKILRDIHEQTK